MDKINIGFIEDEQLVRDSISFMIKNNKEFHLTCAESSVETFLRNSLLTPPDIIILDIGLKGGMSGLEGIRPIKKKYPDCEIIMLTTFDDSERIFKALCAGASAYLTKQIPFSKIVDAIKTVNQGGSYMSPTIARKVVDYFSPKAIKTELTARQEQIVQGIVDGLSYKMVADKLMISTETVRDHIKRIYKKLEINSRTELIKKRIDGII